MLGLLNGSYFIDISGSITVSRSLNFLRRLISNLGDASTVTKLREKDEKRVSKALCVRIVLYLW